MAVPGPRESAAPRPWTAEVVAAMGRRAEPDGFLPFDRFMETALYDPAIGYYSRPRTPFGRTGDFYTAPSVQPTFARTLARRIATVRGTLREQRPFSVVDLGCGDGTLLAGLAQALAQPTGAYRFVGVEVSAERRTSAASHVRESAPGGSSVRFVGSLAELDPFEGVVVANELWDALPARRLRCERGGWRELGLQLRDREARPADRPLTDDPPLLGLPELPADHEGTVIEYAPSADAKLREVADRLAAGLLIVLDYGDEEGPLLAAHPLGTLAAVRAHRSLPTPWEDPGSADLSCWVNFSRLRRAAAASGWTELAYQRQAEALGSWGFAEEMASELAAARSAEDGVRTRLAAKNLLFGFETFRVLELAPPSSAGALTATGSASEAASP